MSPAESASTSKEPLSTTPGSREQLRAMAHPLRLQIIERVGRRGTARAADLAADLGLPANSLSYHLRILARGGVLVEAPEAARDRRDRVWRLSTSRFALGAEAGDDRAGSPEAAAASVAVFDLMRSAWTAHLAATDAAEPGPPASLHSGSLRLSAAQATELAAMVDDRLGQYARLNRGEDGEDVPGDPDSPGGALDYRALFTLVPTQVTPAGRDGDSPAP